MIQFKFKNAFLPLGTPPQQVAMPSFNGCNEFLYSYQHQHNHHCSDSNMNNKVHDELQEFKEDLICCSFLRGATNGMINKRRMDICSGRLP